MVLFFRNLNSTAAPEFKNGVIDYITHVGEEFQNFLVFMFRMKLHLIGRQPHTHLGVYKSLTDQIDMQYGYRSIVNWVLNKCMHDTISSIVVTYVVCRDCVCIRIIMIQIHVCIVCTSNAHARLCLCNIIVCTSNAHVHYVILSCVYQMSTTVYVILSCVTHRQIHSARGSTSNHVTEPSPKTPQEKITLARADPL